jgi:ribonucleoside-diphosphate reductase alpha chain
MESIMDVAKKAAMVQKFGGGVGYYLGNLRAFEAPIKTTHGKAMGPVAKPSEGFNNGVIQHYHSVSSMITQAGKRAGAQMAILPAEHADIHEFIHCKDINPQSLSTFNISVSLGDDFMKKVQDDPTSPERALFMEMCESAWKTGDPGCYFRDTSERSNPTPWLGKLTGTNPCGEVPLLDNEPCNLGSINLAKFVQDGNIDFGGIRNTARMATRYLDDILDHNTFPDKDITEIALTTRKLGLGVMGWADMLALLEMDYDSQGAIDLGQEIMFLIQEAAIEESEKLGQEKGLCPALDKIPGKEHLVKLPWTRRNATVTCIAPTGTISLLVGASSGIEPHFARSWERTMGDGTKLQEKIPVIDILEARGSKFIPKTAMEIGVSWHIRHQAIFQKYTDLAVSKTINLPNSATVQDIFDSYLMMWQTNCKGGTIYRDGSRDVQVLTTPKPDKVETYREEPKVTARRKLPKTRYGVTHHFEIARVPVYFTANWYPDTKEIGEVFVTTTARGGTIDGLLDSIMITLSLALQHQTPLQLLVGRLKGKSFEPKGFTDDPDIPTAESIVDYMMRWFEKEFLKPQVGLQLAPGMICPDCESTVAREEGCFKCTNPSCGWSKC